MNVKKTNPDLIAFRPTKVCRLLFDVHFFFSFFFLSLSKCEDVSKRAYELNNLFSMTFNDVPVESESILFISG